MTSITSSDGNKTWKLTTKTYYTNEAGTYFGIASSSLSATITKNNTNFIKYLTTGVMVSAKNPDDGYSDYIESCSCTYTKQ